MNQLNQPSGRAMSAFALGLLLFLLAVQEEQSAYASRTNASTASNDKITDFDASRAVEHVKKLVEIGPRPPGSETIKKTQLYIENELKSYGLKVSQDAFNARTPRGTVAMKNIIGELPGEKRDILLIAGHYDTKLQPGFVGANDGGSSTAAVLEIARVLSKTRPQYTLWFVFFDGEEALVDWNANNGMDNTYGSRHMVARMVADGSIKLVRALVLLDMIGDKNLDLMRDNESTPWLIEIIWKTAQTMGRGKHFLDADSAYSDDHIPFKSAGVPVIDIIDFNYGPDNSYWHTNQDTLDKVSGESMKIVGDVVIRALPDIFKKLDSLSGQTAR